MPVNKGMSPGMKKLMWLAFAGFMAGFAGFMAVYFLFVA
jgi:hypothetical protein